MIKKSNNSLSKFNTSFEILIICIWMIALISCTNTTKSEKATAKRESLITVDKDIWMAQNLNVVNFKNGDNILLVKNDAEWLKAWEKGLPACRYFKDDKSSASDYGLLYNWYAIADERGLAPDGFHIPTKYEWTNLINYYNSKRDTAEISYWIGNNIDGSSITLYQPNRPFWCCSNYDTTYQEDKIISCMDYTAVCDVYNLRYIFSISDDYRTPYDAGYFVRCIQNKTTNQTNQDSIYNYNSYLLGGELKIGKQIWDKKNLNVTKFRNGDAIYEAKTKEEWYYAGANGIPAYSNYFNWSGYGKIYGKLYNWYAVSDSRGLAPEGWHIPSYKEWMILRKEIYGNKAQPPGSGKRVKNVLWSTKQFISNNQSGFSALPGGSRDHDGGFQDLGYVANWWSSTNESAKYTKEMKGVWYYYPSAYSVYVQDFSNYFDGSQIINTVYQPKSYGLSIRCIKD